MKSPSVEVKVSLDRLRRASAATHRLLFGNVADIPAAVVARPDLTALRPKLAQLSSELEFDCVELATIIQSAPQVRTILDLERTQAESFARSLWLAKSGVKPSRRDSDNLAAIHSVVDTGDVDTFIKIGNYLRRLRAQKGYRSGTKKPPMVGSLFKFELVKFWIPDGSFPGLAYCKTPAIKDFLEFIAGANRADIKEFDKFWGKDHRKMVKNLVRTLDELGLVRSRKPFVSCVRADVRHDESGRLVSADLIFS